MHDAQKKRRRHQTSYNIARLLLMALIKPWQNSTPFFGAVVFCTTKIDDFKRQPERWRCRKRLKKLKNLDNLKNKDDAEKEDDTKVEDNQKN